MHCPARYLLTALLIGAPLLAQKPPSLVLVEDIYTNGVCDKRRLVRYRFHGGQFGPEEIVLTEDQRFFSHFGGHRIFADRYVVTKYAGVVDLKTKKVISTEIHGRIVDCDAKRVTYRIANANRKNGYFAFEYATQKVTEVQEPGVFALTGARSPDGRRTAHMSDDGVLTLRSPKQKPKELARGFSLQLSRLSSGWSGGAPIHWLDGKTLLTQKKNGVLVTVDLAGKTRPFTTIAQPHEPIGRPRFRVDPDGRLVYQCAAEHILDPKRRTATPLERHALGHGFAFEPSRKESHAILFHRGKKIGEMVALTWAARTRKGFLAVPIAKPKKLGYPHAVRVYDAANRKWLEFEAQVNALIGWTH